MIQCPAIPVDGSGGLALALSAIDCQLSVLVQAGYARIFGDQGALALALRALLVIWVAVLGLSLIGGHLRLRTLGPRVMVFMLVLTLATAWPAYQAVVYGLLVGGPDQIASGFLGASHGATQAFAARLDQLFASLVELGRSFDAQAGEDANLKLATRMVWSSALLLLCSTVGVLVVARVVLAALLALGPVFIALGLFRSTRGLCEGWLRMALAFALLPMLVTLSGAALLRVLGPAVELIARDPLDAVQRQTPLLMLLLGCVIHLGLLLAMAWAAAGIVRGWRLHRAGADARSVPDGVFSQTSALSPRTITLPELGAGTSAQHAQAMLSALQTAAGHSSSASTRIMSHRGEGLASSSAQSGAVASRRDRLGQRFRVRPTASALGHRFR